MFGSIDIKLRPLRLAYLVDPGDTQQVREAIRLSSVLWGGANFPIIPLHKRMPQTWRDKPFKVPRSKDVIAGYLDAFDMRLLAKTFPGAILVFSTLRKSLNKNEIKAITSIAKAGRKYWKADRPINPVMILTGTELLSWDGPPYCWEKGSQQKFDRAHGLIGLCDASQQIYLKLPSWQTEWHQKWENRRRHASQGASAKATPALGENT